MGSVTALVLTVFASRIGTGAVSVFTFAGNLAAVPLALIGSSYAIAAFPALSEASTVERREEFTRILSAGARHVILWSVVSIGLIVVLRAHIVRVILGTGAFDWNATRLTAALLAILAVGLVAQGLILLFSRVVCGAAIVATTCVSMCGRSPDRRVCAPHFSHSLIQGCQRRLPRS